MVAGDHDSPLFIIFAFSFTRPQTRRDWRSFYARDVRVLVVMYGYLAVREEAEMRAQFGNEYERYAARTPRFVPDARGLRTVDQG